MVAAAVVAQAVVAAAEFAVEGFVGHTRVAAFVGAVAAAGTVVVVVEDRKAVRDTR